VLSLGEGEGRNGVYLAELGYEVVGVDASAVGLEKARRLARDRGVALTTVCADLAEYRIEPGAWSGIVSIFCHLPPELRRRIHGEVVAGLRPGGVFLLEAYTPEQLRYATGGPPDPERLMRLEDVRTELAGLRLVVAREVERPVREGRCHHGPAAVLQVVAERPRKGETAADDSGS